MAEFCLVTGVGCVSVFLIGSGVLGGESAADMA
jgi:hypothetical protein